MHLLLFFRPSASSVPPWAFGDHVRFADEAIAGPRMTAEAMSAATFGGEAFALGGMSDERIAGPGFAGDATSAPRFLDEVLN